MTDTEQRKFPGITIIMSLLNIRSPTLEILPLPEYQAIDTILNTELGQSRHARLVRLLEFVFSCELVSTHGLLDVRKKYLKDRDPVSAADEAASLSCRTPAPPESLLFIGEQMRHPLGADLALPEILRQDLVDGIVGHSHHL